MQIQLHVLLVLVIKIMCLTFQSQQMLKLIRSRDMHQYFNLEDLEECLLQHSDVLVQSLVLASNPEI